MSIIAPRRQLLTVKEAAQWLRCSERTIRRLIRRGEIQAVRRGGVGSTILIDSEELEQWLFGDEAA